jgi:hypothetical protein
MRAQGQGGAELKAQIIGSLRPKSRMGRLVAGLLWICPLFDERPARAGAVLGIWANELPTFFFAVDQVYLI